MFASWKTTVSEPGIGLDQIKASRFMTGGRSCDPKRKLGSVSDFPQLSTYRPTMGLVRKERSVCQMWISPDHTQLISSIPRGVRMSIGKDAYSGPHSYLPSPTREQPYTSFLLNNVRESRVEKSQIVETFGSPYVLFFGERPQVEVFTGVLLNAANFSWRTQFWELYDKYLRGTQCVKMRSKVAITWDDVAVDGYMLSAEATEDAEMPNVIHFRFSFLVTSWTSLGNFLDQGSRLEMVGGSSGDLLAEMRDVSTQQWVILSPSLRAYIAAGGVAKLTRMLGELGVPGLEEGDTAARVLKYISNPASAGLGELEKKVGAGNLMKGSRALDGVEGMLNKATGGKASQGRSWLMRNVMCLNAGFSSLMYGSGQIAGTILEGPALTLGGVRKLTGGELSTGEGLDRLGEVTHSMERYPDKRETVGAGKATWGNTFSSWETLAPTPSN